jgi:hypothetical protein
MFEKIFPKDEMTKRERVERALGLLSTDRVPLHDQLSYNPGLISRVTGKQIAGFNYTVEDIGATISKTLDACFPAFPPCGIGEYTDENGFSYKNDNWTRWHVSRPFSDEHGAKEWLCRRIRQEQQYKAGFDANSFRLSFRTQMQEQQRLVGETVVIDHSISTGFCDIYDRMGLEIYTFFSAEYPDTLLEYMELSTENAVNKANAAADLTLSPVVLIAEDFSTKQGPIFSPTFLHKYHYPYVKRLTRAWKKHGFKVIYHSDGNYKSVIPDLISCEVDGFYCLEPNCGMDIVELKKLYPTMVWAGGVDGVDLLERGTPEQARAEVRRHILETGALRNGGMLIGSSSEINPPIHPENFLAMVEAADTVR